jgi:pyridoxine 5-phosphate synthase
MALLLGVNIDHIATLRQARYAQDPHSPNAEPCPLRGGRDAIAGGADSLTIHVRGDRRHMQDADAFEIRRELEIPLNLEIAVTEEMLGLALRLKPEFVCLVPENRQEITTEGGLDMIAGFEKICTLTAQLQEAGILVSVFIDPDLGQIDAAVAARADMIELHTGAFANAEGQAVPAELERLVRAAIHSHQQKLQVNAGHGINYTNIAEILTIPHLTELNIGHSIIARATRCGLTAAVQEMKALMAHYSVK